MKHKLMIIALIFAFIGCASTDKPPVAVNPADTEQAAVESEQKKENSSFDYKANNKKIGDSILDFLISDPWLWN